MNKNVFGEKHFKVDMEGADMYSIENIRDTDPEIAEAIEKEIGRQNDHIELIASENWVSKAVMEIGRAHV